MSAIPKISSMLNMGKENLEKESLKTYLHVKLRRCESEIFKLDHLEAEKESIKKALEVVQ